MPDILPDVRVMSEKGKVEEAIKWIASNSGYGL
jgi:hypothetical protein